jgi:hypothetical protein
MQDVSYLEPSKDSFDLSKAQIDGGAAKSTDREDSYSSLWRQLAQEVNRVFNYVDGKLAKNSNWLNSSMNDLTNLQEEILSAFNVDIRQSANDKNAIRVLINDQLLICRNGLFYKQINNLFPRFTSIGVKYPCIGELALLSDAPIQCTLMATKDTNIFTLDPIGILESKL